jgi:flagellar assembly protein FliH
MGAPVKYLFDVDFASSGKPGRTISLTEHTEKLNEAYRNGFAAAEAQAASDNARRSTIALEKIGRAAEEMARGLRAIENRLEAEAVEVAMAVGSKLAPALIAREPFAEVAALATECFRQLIAAPHVVVRINDQLYETARQGLDEIAKRAGFEGRLVVLAEPELAPGDCRIEWADGGITRTRAAAEALVAEAVQRYVAVRDKADPAEGPETMKDAGANP